MGDLRNGGGEKLARHIEAYGYRLVVIDTLSRAIQGDQNDTDVMTRALAPLQEMAHDKGCAILLNDHHRKSLGSEPDTIADILGSTAKGAMVDTAMGLYRDNTRVGANLQFVGREVEENTVPLTFDGTTCTWQAQNKTNGVQLTDRVKDIQDFLCSHGQSSLTEIATAVGADRSNTHKRVQKLVAAGVVQRLDEEGTLLYELST